jgi:5-methylcytosine-specific restriction endonuclease McrA
VRGYHLPARDTERGIIRVYPVVDHIHPQSHQGGHHDANLAAACDPHNTAKSNNPGWVLLSARRDEWRGLLTQLPSVAAIAGDMSDSEWLQIADACRR